MTTESGIDTTSVVLLLLGALLVLPLLGMGMMVGFGGRMGYGGMMGYGGTGGFGWWPMAALVVALVFLIALLGGGYLLLRRTGTTGTDDPAIAELREAYARGELSDEEFDSRRERLERSE